MAEIKLTAKHGDFNIEVTDKDTAVVISKYQELLMLLEQLSRVS